MPESYTGAEVESGYERKALAKTKTIDHFKRRLSDAASWCSRLWEEAEENERFVIGGEHQWDTDDYKARVASARATLSMNDIILAINAISGRQFVGRQVPTFLGRSGLDDEGFVEAAQEFSRKIRQIGYYDTVVSHAFRRQLIHAYSWTERWQDLSQPPLGVGRTTEEPIPLWEMIWDPNATIWNLLDREWDARGRFISYEAFIARYPEQEDKTDQILASSNPNSFIGAATEKTQRWPFLYVGQGRFRNLKRQEIFLIDYHWKQRTWMHLIRPAPDGFDLEMFAEAIEGGGVRLDADEGKDILAQIDSGKHLKLSRRQYDAYAAGYEESLGERFSSSDAVAIPQWEFRRAEVAGEDVMMEERMPHKRFPRQCMTGFPFEQQHETIFKSVVYLMKHPQQFKNQIFSLAVTMLQHAPKANLFHEPGAFRKPKEVTAKLSQPFALIALNKDGKKKLDWGPQTLYPPGLDSFLEHADTAVWRPIGLTPQVLGQIPDLRRISGEVFRQVKDSVEMVLSYPFESLRVHNLEGGRLDLEFMKAYYDWEDVRRIIGDEKAYGPPVQEIGEDGQPVFDVDPETQQQTPKMLSGPDKPPETWALPPKESWDEMAEFDVVYEERPVSVTERHEWFDFMTRTGTLEKLLDQGHIPMQLFWRWVPNIPESDRRELIAHAEAMQAAAQQPPPEGPPAQ